MEDIFHSVRDGNGPVVRAWLESTENDFNQGDDHGFTLLHWASWDGQVAIVDMLLSKGAKINPVNKCEDTPLHCACQNNHVEVACMLVKQKANLLASNIHGNTPLHYACHFGFVELATELLKLGAPLGICNRYNQTPLELCTVTSDRLPEQLIQLTDALKLNTDRISFSEEQTWRWSKTRNLDTVFYNQSANINIDELPVEKMLDSNHGGTTWKGFWQGVEVVIKVLKLREATQRTASAFNQEAKRLRIFNSAHVLPVLATCISLPDLIVVTQFMCHGSLYSVLHEQQTDLILTESQAINIALCIAKGMDFLANLEAKPGNLQLNSKHVMIDEDLNAKINMADCSFSFADKGKVYDPAWVAPEALRKRLDPSASPLCKQQADMWSFAIVLWELRTRKVPFAGAYSPMQLGLLIVKESLRVELTAGSVNPIDKLIRICMNEDPQKRPAFDKIIPILEKLCK